MFPYQKGQLENIHIQLRYILPKEKDLYALGLENQTDLNKVISIINSIPRKELNNKTNFMFCSMFAPVLIKKIEEFNIK